MPALVSVNVGLPLQVDWRGRKVRTEIFGSEPLDGAQRAPHPPPGEPAAGPEVAFTTTGLTVRWDPAFGSLLELAEACDMPVAWSAGPACATAASAGLSTASLPTPPIRSSHPRTDAR
jgi:hypothetical protein